MTDNDTLFPVEPSQPTRLQLARAQFERAKSDLEKADAHEDESGEETPDWVYQEYNKARLDLNAAEREALEKRP